MHSPDPAQVQFEEAVAVGGVFSPALLTALPFLSSAEARIAIATLLAVLLASTIVGYFVYRRQIHVSRSFQWWRTSLLLLLASALLSAMVALASELGGSLAGVGTVVCFLLLAAAAWKKMPQSPADAYEGGRTIAGVAGGLGAASAGVLSLAFGPSFVHAVVVALHFSLGLIATILLIRASREARASQTAA